VLELEKALETGEKIEGMITGKVKGGLTVMAKASERSCRARWWICAR